MARPDPDRTRQLFDAALDLPEADRAAFVRARCADDPALGARVIALLDQARADSFLDSPLPVAAMALRSSAAIAPQPGDRIGPYTLVRAVGEGGFGLVFEAEQRTPVVRTVALKVLKAGMDTAQVVARFAQEQQALALLDHPGIARIHDGGATPAGRPFFVMDYVPGLPLTTHCDRHGMAVADRLRLFAQVCDAVQHAHGRGIIHRDLKPSNVLVAAREGVPQVKIIDFGIAKAIGGSLTEHSLRTAASQVIGTLDYMSPEQADGAADIDIRTDVYSLGALLYELLTGVPPLQTPEPRADSLQELQRRVREVDPPLPSQRITATARTGHPVPAAGRAPTSRLVATVRGELDWITAKALEKDRRRRYATANDLATDIRHHLAGEPVAAAPPSAVYRLRKLVGRHRGLLAAAAAVLLTLIVGVVAFAWQAAVARDERDRALLAGRQAQAIQSLLVDALGAADAIEGGSSGALVVDAMARAAAMLADGRLAGQPLVEMNLLTTIAGVQAGNGAAAAALPHALRALELAREHVAGDDERTVVALNAVGFALRNLDRTEAEEPLRREALQMARRLWPEGHSLLVQTMRSYAQCLFAIGRPAESATLLAECLALAERMFHGDDWVVAGVRNEIGHQHFVARRHDLALSQFVDAVAMAERLHPGDHARKARFLANEAAALSALGRHGEAIATQREAMAMTERCLGAASAEVASRHFQLGTQLVAAGDTEGARREFEAALELNRRLFAGDSEGVAQCLYQLGDLRLRYDDAAGAESLLAEGLAMLRRLHPGDHPDVAASMAELAGVQRRLGKKDGVEALTREALAMARRVYPGDHPEVLDRIRSLGFLLWSDGRFDEATAAFGEGLAMLRRLRPGDSVECVDALDDLGSAELGPGNPREGDPAAAARTFGEALAMARRLPAYRTTDELRIALKLLQCRLCEDDAAAAAAHLADVAAICMRPDLPEASDMQVALRRAAGNCHRIGSYDAAARLLAVCVSLSRRHAPDGDLETANAAEELGIVELARHDPVAAATAFEEALAAARRQPTPDEARIARLEQRLAACRTAPK